MALTTLPTAALADDAVDNTKLDLAANYAFTGSVSGAGSHEKLHSITASNGDSDITFSSTYITSDYDKFFFTFQNVIPNNGSNYFIARISFDNGTFYKTTQYDKVSFEGHEGTASDVINSRYSANTGYMMITGSSGFHPTFADSAFNGVAYFHNTDVDYKSMSFMGNYQYSGGNHVGVYSSHRVGDNRTDRCNNIKFYWNSGTWLSGKITLYGVRQ